MIAARDFRLPDIPNAPGIYVFRDRLREVIYVGKAKSLRRRLASYFQPSRRRTDDPKLRSLIHSIAFVEFHTVRNEPESLLLESRLVKQYTPRYNALLRDDKRFLLIKLDRAEPFPRLQLARLQKDDGATYYGPFPVAGALRDTVRYLTEHFGLRTCTPRLPGAADYRHCHADVIRHCAAPCLAKVSAAEYRQRVEALLAVVGGQTAALAAELAQRMTREAASQRFERAARLRDVQRNLEAVFGQRPRQFVRARLRTYPGAAGVAALQAVLDLPRPPAVIECFDISNIMGEFTVASLVCFRDGQPAPRDYRRFRIRTVTGSDDCASVREVIERRFRRLLAEARPLPDLAVIDGGAGQLAAAYETLVRLRVDERVPVISLAKREEEIFTTTASAPVRLAAHEPALRLVQALRDEAHRFALTYHRELRRQRIAESLLDDVPGVGPARKQALLRAFGSVAALRQHPAAEIARRVPAVGPRLAAAIVRHLGAAPAQPDPSPPGPPA